MMPELGQIALVLALILSVCLGILPMLAAALNNSRLIALAGPATAGQFVFVAFAFGILSYAFMVQDFSIVYVATNSNLDLPVRYRISAVWGAHEGSLLLWSLILCAWSLAVAAFSGALPERMRARVLATLGLISSGFLSFLIFTSNPFARHVPPLADGNDLNPLLQDFGLIIHPPMLYMGYVGMAVPFAFAIAALLEGRVDQQWVRWSRPWTNAAWACLTLGIALGSWWAYYELGWGGWWFWDPVENASFMPWLVGAALIHSQAVTEKRGTFRNWTLLLAIVAFSLSLLGTFLVRSGVLTSVHAFASDPERGVFILIFLCLVSGGALVLFALRAPRISTPNSAGLVSKETLLLANNVLLISACMLVLIGTLFPLLSEAMNWGKYSVGAPWFGFMFPLFTVPLLLLLPLGAFTRWNGDTWRAPVLQLRFAAGAALVGASLVWLSDGNLPLKAVGGLLVAFWVVFGTLAFVLKRYRERRPGVRVFSAEMLGMTLAHLGLGLWLTGVVLTESMSTERDIRMVPGDVVEVGTYQLRFVSVIKREGANFHADQGRFELLDEGQVVDTLLPEKRLYRRGEVMTEAAIDPSLWRDIYVALGEPVSVEEQAWAVRAYHKPFIRFIWLGALFMMAGGLVAATERRLRATVSAAPADAGVTLEKPVALGTQTA